MWNNFAALTSLHWRTEDLTEQKRVQLWMVKLMPRVGFSMMWKGFATLLEAMLLAVYRRTRNIIDPGLIIRPEGMEPDLVYDLEAALRTIVPLDPLTGQELPTHMI